jgi:NAD(P)-dependent dehydrogenase (short-subunit alcohol dehydrogenase family)
MSVAGTRSVVVTGASSGIGRAVARRLAAAGWRVFAGVRRDEDAAALDREGAGAIVSVRLDVTSDEQAAAACRRVAAEVGAEGLGALVNNAGIVACVGPLERVPLEAVRRQFEVNVLGAVRVTQAFLPLLRRGRGRIVLVGSAAGRVALPFSGPYAMSKHALEAMADALRRELDPWDLRVVLVGPGVVRTAIWDKGEQAGDWPAEAGDAVAARYRERQARGWEQARAEADRGVDADAVARVVARALTARSPRPRYRVGPRSGLSALAARLPKRWADALVRWRLPG